MSELGTNVQTESLQHMLDCRKGKHDLQTIQSTFWYDHHYFVHGTCAYCHGNFYTKDNKVISEKDFFAAYDLFTKH